MNKSLLALPLLLGALPVWAGGSLSGQYVASANLEVESTFGSGDIDGDGFAAELSFDLSEQAFVYGEIFNRSYDEGSAEMDLDQTRFGIGVVLNASEAGSVWIGAGSERFKVSDSTGSESSSGYSLRAGVTLPLGTGPSLHAQVAYLDIEDSSGAELGVGISIPAGEGLNLIANYRLTSIEDDNSSDKLTLDDLSLGLRLDF